MKQRKDTQKLKQELDKYKKRYQRAMLKLKEVNQDSPRTRTRTLLIGCKKVTGRVRRTLDFHHVLTSSMKRAIHEIRQNGKTRQERTSIIAGRIIKQYRMQRALKVCTDLPRIRNYRANAGRKSKLHSAGEQFKASVQEFYCRDDNSRMTPGKKQTITKQKKKMQKRLLSDSLRNLHQKFLTDNPRRRISYSLFCKIRPFWVVPPSLQDMETCLCKSHENLEFITTTMQKMKLLEISNLEQLADSVACNPKSKVCMYGECAECKEKIVEMPSILDGDTEVKFFQWKTVKEPIPESQDKQRTSVITKKTEITSTKYQLQDDFQNRLLKFRRHIFNIRHQFSRCRDLRNSLQKSECIIHIDFSENYSGKYSREVQSVHFGGSHKQITLHTGMLYVGGIDEGIAFCTVSASRRHDPIAIWAYLDPLFAYLGKSHPEVQVIHFFSDGPTTQYRQKGNFFLFSKNIFSYGYLAASWNFWEASHGKGAPDGVGGALKRTADKLVKQGLDIPDANAFYRAILQTTTIKLFLVEPEEVEKGTLPNLPALPGTMRLHQLITTQPGSLTYRDVSCFCASPERLQCDCFSPKEFAFPQQLLQLNTTSNAVSVQIDETPLPSAAADHQSEPTLTSESPDPTTKTIPSEDLTQLTNRWVLVKYDGKVYPGIVQNIEESDIEVKCMNKIGENRFFWPRMEDKIWYVADDVVAIIPEPEKVGSRHVKVNETLWKLYNS